MLCAIFFSVTTLAQQPENELFTKYKIINVGILAPTGKQETFEKWSPMMRWLENKIPGYYFRLHPYNLEQLAVEVSTQKLDFFITNPEQSVELSHKYVVTWLATLKSSLLNGSTKTIGSAFVVRSNSPYREVVQLKGKKIAAVSIKAFGGYLAFVNEVKIKGIDIEQLFSNVIYTGFPLDKLINQLADHHAEAAIVPVCHLEKMIDEGLITATQFRVLNNKTPKGFDCLTSTDLYPNWSFAKTVKVSPQLAKAVTIALLELPENSKAANAVNSLGWGAAASKLAIDGVLMELDIHPMMLSLPQRAIKWLVEHRVWASFIVMTFILLNIYHFLLEYRFSKSKRLLINTQKKLNEKNSMLEHAQRVAIVGELGSSIAHEINQPLSAIHSYSEGAIIRIDKGSTASEIRPILSKIHQQVETADHIIQRLRLLIKKRIIDKQFCQLEPLIEDIFQLLEHYSVEHKISLAIIGQSTAIYIDPVGFSQLLLNVIKNGIESCSENKHGVDENEDDAAAQSNEASIGVMLYYLPDTVKITITDNGPGLKENTDVLQNAFYSTKANGLGLGLAICREVIEGHHGKFTMKNVAPTGCEVEIILPLIRGLQQ